MSETKFLASLWRGIDPVLCMVAATQLISAVLGIIVSLHEEWSKRHKLVLLLGFIILGVIGTIGTIAQGASSAQEMTAANTKVADGIRSLETATKENNRLSNLNTDLQKRLLSQNQMISGLAKKAINSVTGGNSFCYLSMMNRNSDRGDFILLQEGDFPLYEINVRAVDVSSLNEHQQQGVDTFQDMENLTTYFDVAAMPPDTGRMASFHLPIRHTDAQDYNVFFSGRNGFWTELIRLRKVNGTWLQATRVDWEFKNAKHERHSLPWVRVDPNYPAPLDWK